MSNTYRRGRAQSSMRTLAEKSTDQIDYRSRLIYINIKTKHPRMNPDMAKALANNRAVFVTIFQKPLVWLRGVKMKALLLFAKLKNKKK